NYLPVTATTTITVTQAAQAIAFGPLPDRTFGDAGFTVQLPPGPSGNPVRYRAAGPCLARGENGGAISLTGAGRCTLTAYEPGDFNYLGAFAGPVSFTIARARPTISWRSPAPITRGTALGSRQLNAQASFQGRPVRGRFTYTPPAGTKFAAGPRQTVSVTFTPADGADYTGATATTTIAVNKAPTRTRLAASANPGTRRHAVTLTATVTSSAAGAGTPGSGTVTFTDGGTNLGHAPVSAGGVATLSASFSTTGAHAIAAHYSGNGSFSGSTAVVLSEKIT
ncbi:MAG: hypothetical protein JWO59_2304, partial [Chloroflexi bacterium]|nr:hypothetical protein [Chloroflexota bacterium]